MAIRLLLCDDHPLMRAAIREVLEGSQEVEIVAEAATATELFEQLPDARPDIVLLDINLPGRKGIGIIAELLRVCPAARVVVLTMHEEPSYLRFALAAGASGYLLKESAGEDLMTAIREVLAGRSFVDPWFQAHLAHKARHLEA